MVSPALGVELVLESWLGLAIGKGSHQPTITNKSCSLAEVSCEWKKGSL